MSLISRKHFQLHQKASCVTSHVVYGIYIHDISGTLMEYPFKLRMSPRYIMLSCFMFYDNGMRLNTTYMFICDRVPYHPTSCS